MRGEDKLKARNIDELETRDEDKKVSKNKSSTIRLSLERRVL